MKNAYATSSFLVYRSARSSKKMENLYHAKVVSLTPWRVETKKVRGGVIAEAAAAVHAELASQTGGGAGAAAVRPPQTARMIPVTAPEVRLPPDQLLLWGQMVVSALIVAASLQIACRVACVVLCARVRCCLPHGLTPCHSDLWNHRRR